MGGLEDFSRTAELEQEVGLAKGSAMHLATLVSYRYKLDPTQLNHSKTCKPITSNVPSSLSSVVRVRKGSLHFATAGASRARPMPLVSHGSCIICTLLETLDLAQMGAGRCLILRQRDVE